MANVPQDAPRTGATFERRYSHRCPLKEAERGEHARLDDRAESLGRAVTPRGRVPARPSVAHGAGAALAHAAPGTALHGVGEPPPGQHACEVFVVRHGERLDEVPGPERDRWMRACGERSFDPPLTARGQRQAFDSARMLFVRLQAVPKPFDVIYTSPLQRCVSTAAAFAEVFGLPMRVVPALGECCAALRAKNKLSQPRWERLMTPEDLSRLCPTVTFLEPDTVPDELYLSAAATCAGRLARGRERLLVVTHREGIRSLAARKAHVPGRAPAPLAGVGHFSCRQAGADGEAWEFHGVLNGSKDPRGPRVAGAADAAAFADDPAEQELEVAEP
eukprot:CAMPEP_0198493564 /NCGR_PEP_ID=MMETSP1462-20131121/4096_1 /TAXON_ID=1333877 /ORGANISM="Brandtodinium nutriculum, Strain RCC3387" /LENGTH=332 /DNA_ID=CAMNT_0044222261 /DNA_START=115 /DNA_END=1109 /DNA_ORIENTATION=+